MPKPSSKNLLADRFTAVSDECKPRIVGASYGEVGTLKTSFWLGAPGPIFVQSTDEGLEGVAEEFRKGGKEIYAENYDPNTTDLEQDGAIEIRNKMLEDLDYFIEHSPKGTILWDKETQIYDIFKFAEFGAPSDNPSNYYALYQRYRRVFSKIKASDLNFGVIQGMKTPWVAKVKPNGKTGAVPSTTARVRRGMPEVEELVHINIEHFLDDETNKFMMKIGKSRGPGGQAIQNQTIEFTPFAELAVAIFPDTTEEDWQ